MKNGNMCSDESQRFSELQMKQIITREGSQE